MFPAPHCSSKPGLLLPPSNVPVPRSLTMSLPSCFLAAGIHSSDLIHWELWFPTQPYLVTSLLTLVPAFRHSNDPISRQPPNTTVMPQASSPGSCTISKIWPSSISLSHYYLAHSAIPLQKSFGLTESLIHQSRFHPFPSPSCPYHQSTTHHECLANTIKYLAALVLLCSNLGKPQLWLTPIICSAYSKKYMLPGKGGGMGDSPTTVLFAF